jgi:hypothetical protein
VALETTSEYSTGLNSGAFPWRIAAGPDGNLWFTDIFIVHQTTGATPRTYFILSQPLTGCQTPVGPAHIASEAKVFEARAKRRKGPRSRHVWVTEQGGRFNTQGQYVSTSVEGTTWLTADTCTSSSVTVSQGVVKVRDLVRRRTVTLHAGQSYTARKRR